MMTKHVENQNSAHKNQQSVKIIAKFRTGWASGAPRPATSTGNHKPSKLNTQQPILSKRDNKINVIMKP